MEPERFPKITDKLCDIEDCLQSLKQELKTQKNQSKLKEEKCTRIVRSLEQICGWRRALPTGRLCDEKCYPYLKIEKN